jgi:hypothetical protein
MLLRPIPGTPPLQAGCKRSAFGLQQRSLTVAAEPVLDAKRERSGDD